MSHLCDQQREALNHLLQQAAARARAEEETTSRRDQGLQTAEKELHQAQRCIQDQHDSDRAAADQQYLEHQQRLQERFEQDFQAASVEYEQVLQTIQDDYEQVRGKTRAAFKESRWTIGTVFEADKKVAREEREKTIRRAKASHDKVQSSHQEAVQQLQAWGLLDELSTAIEKGKSGEAGDPLRALQQTASLAQAKLAQLREMKSPAWLRGARLALVVAAAWLLCSVPALWLEGWYFWLGGTVAVFILAGWGLRSWLARQARHQGQGLFTPLCQAVAEAVVLKSRCRALAEGTYQQQREEIKQRHKQTLDQAKKETRLKLRDHSHTRGQRLKEAEITYPARLQDIQKRHDEERHHLDDQYQRRCSFLEKRRQRELQQAQEKFQQQTEETQQTFVAAWDRLSQSWQEAVDYFASVTQTVDEQCRLWFPPWDDPGWQSWQLPQSSPPALQFGTVGITTERIPQGTPTDPGLARLELEGCTFPALLPFPGRASLLLETHDQGRVQAVATVQEVMLRWLTALPPGKVRLTILDPVGRGENFGAFMHLADFDEQLISSRIWTESGQLDQRLADLTTQMEMVIQKYLRNQFRTLEEYNAQAGEMAEPYRLLVVANFPVNFTSDAARRLVSLVSSGARCGIHALITVDTKQDWPQGFALADLEQVCTTLAWQGSGFEWRDADFGTFPLVLNQPPTAEFTTNLLQVVGEQARLASRVEVPFSLLVPPADQWWTADTRKGLAVPLGKAGATRQQCLELGQGTAQHVLLAGKTGSGKSTLLHALITQIALRFSPDEVSLFLIDFKKGVEFKTYAVNELPHARVVAVESEREFGLSVLQRLDLELQQRGAIFRQLGTTDLQGYRGIQDALPAEQRRAMPRLLLVVDEFQEFFVEDDKTAQEAALLLDRLVRQGRAFGIHVLLGSQTLGGAYSLARSTIDQMAVRIALQCSEADAHMILNKDNAAARLLSRPGEAIYNAANGALEGNNLFQVVWLSDDHRDTYLQQVRELAEARGFQPEQPQIVFEGTAPSLLRKNSLLARCLTETPAAPVTPRAWLGEAVAIKDPTAAVFRRQSGANLLLIGQDDEMSFNMLVACLVSLSAQLRQPSVDGVPSLALVVGTGREAAAQQVLERLPELFPIRVLTPRELPDFLNNLAEEVDRRQQIPTAGPPIFLALFGLQRLRDLRKAEDDFSFGRRSDGPPPPSKQFAHVVREGPPLGVHVVGWCDTYSNLTRVLDRQTLRDFEMRVLLQMSAADSSNLIDSPLAARLGAHRALYYTEDQGRMEKFRPYGLPELDWLQTLPGKKVLLPSASE